MKTMNFMTIVVVRRSQITAHVSDGRALRSARVALFEPSFCRPATGHDKGGVESRGKAIRWQHLVPIPSGGNLHEVSETLLARLDARPIATLSLEAQEMHERREKVYRDE